MKALIPLATLVFAIAPTAMAQNRPNASECAEAKAQLSRKANEKSSAALRTALNCGSEGVVVVVSAIREWKLASDPHAVGRMADALRGTRDPRIFAAAYEVAESEAVPPGTRSHALAVLAAQVAPNVGFGKVNGQCKTFYSGSGGTADGATLAGDSDKRLLALARRMSKETQSRVLADTAECIVSALGFLSPEVTDLTKLSARIACGTTIDLRNDSDGTATFRFAVEGDSVRFKSYDVAVPPHETKRWPVIDAATVTIRSQDVVLFSGRLFASRCAEMPPIPN